MKFSSTEQDHEDFEQELLIKQWLEKKRIEDQFDFKYISKNETPRTSNLKASLSLDQPITEGENGNFHDYFVGIDAREFYNEEPEPGQIVREHLYTLLRNKELVLWVEKTLKRWITRSDQLYRILVTDLE